MICILHFVIWLQLIIVAVNLNAPTLLVDELSGLQGSVGRGLDRGLRGNIHPSWLLKGIGRVVRVEEILLLVRLIHQAFSLFSHRG